MMRAARRDKSRAAQREGPRAPPASELGSGHGGSEVESAVARKRRQERHGGRGVRLRVGVAKWIGLGGAGGWV